MSLETEVSEKRKVIHADGYPMSIGELINLYEAGELDVHPEFQRIYRWTETQKSKLIESILLGIPIPSIFVSQREDGVWDVVDGVQRLSTIFQFVGVLVNDEGKKIEPMQLEKTVYLPSLGGKYFDHKIEGKTIGRILRIDFKREKVDIKIIKKESDSSTKFELFQRLNTLGSKLSEQEIRNCMLVMINKGLFEWLRELSDNKAFRQCISISERLEEEQYPMELALRFISCQIATQTELNKINDVHDFLTDMAVKMAGDDLENKFDRKRISARFENTFDLLYMCLGDSCFRRYNKGKMVFEGPFSLAAYEAISSGVGKNVDEWLGLTDSQSKNQLKESVVKVWRNEEFQRYSGSGVRASRRLPKLIPLGKNMLKPKG